jgi:hypothetical protein
LLLNILDPVGDPHALDRQRTRHRRGRQKGKASQREHDAPSGSAFALADFFDLGAASFFRDLVDQAPALHPRNHTYHVAIIDTYAHREVPEIRCFGAVVARTCGTIEAAVRALSQRSSAEGRGCPRRVTSLAVALWLTGCFTDSGVGGSSSESTSGSSSGSGTESTSGSTSESTATTESTSETLSSSTSAGPSSTTSDPGSTSEVATTTGPDMLTVDMLQPGDLIITEYMPDPTCSNDDCEWIEVLNTTGVPIDLMGLGVGVGVGSLTGTILTSPILGPGEYAVLTKSAADWPYMTAEYDAEYGDAVSLPNDPASYVVRIGTTTTEIDRTAQLSPASVPAGSSLTLSPMALDGDANNDVDSWCDASSTLIPLMEYGTPGAINDGCG